MLKVEGVNQYYGGSHILRNVGFEAKAGEVTVVLGRNGVGKTTLLKSLMGVIPIKTGSIALDGVALNKDTSYERVRKGIGYVPQGREIFGIRNARIEQGAHVQFPRRGSGIHGDAEGAVLLVQVVLAVLITGGVIAAIPPVLIALLFQRYLVSGLTSGAVKG